MINKEEAKIEAWMSISELFSVEYFRTHFEGSCEAYPKDTDDEVIYEYFIGFEGSEDTGLWNVFARVAVNRETAQVSFLDYRKPDGTRMENPIKPVRLA